MSRSLFFAMFLLALLSLCPMMGGSPGLSPNKDYGDSATSNGFKILPILLHDLVDEGLIKKGHKGFVLGACNADMEDDYQFLTEAGIDLLTRVDMQQTNDVPHQVFDFVFSTSCCQMQLIDGFLKQNGLVISPLDREPSDGVRLLDSYKIVYLRRFENTVVAMRKMWVSSNGPKNSAAEEVLCGTKSQEKEAALQALEDVDLEPPKRATLEEKTSFTSRKIKFLPDLLKDSLDKYPRRVFVTDDLSAPDWFYNNYPTRDQEFEVYKVEDEVNNVGSSQEAQIGLSKWLKKNVRQGDYVVVKAEARVVEEMLEDDSLCLVDELFLGCKNQSGDDDEDSANDMAYWQCLALYGKVRDVGIAVHQWWN